jgi:hypothetical protein
MVIFATPDFGADGCCCLIPFIIAFMLIAVGAVWGAWPFQKRPPGNDSRSGGNDET